MVLYAPHPQYSTSCNAMHVRWNYCNMETLHLVDVYIYIHCVIGKQCSVLDSWTHGSAPWRHIADTSAVRADGSRIRRLVNCDSAMRWGNLTGHHIWTGLLVSTNLLALYWEAELSPLILSPDSVSIRVNHFHLKRINRSPIIWHFKRNQMLTRTNPF